MNDENATERSQEATPRRRERAWREGVVARSPEVISALISLCLLGVIAWWAPWAGAKLVSQMREAMALGGWSAIVAGDGVTVLRGLADSVLRLVLPVAGLCAVVGVAGNVGQVGFGFETDLLEFKWERLNPMGWLKRMASWDLPFGLLKSLVKGVGVVALAVWALRDEFSRFANLSFASVTDLGVQMQGLAWLVFSRVTVIMIGLAVTDWLWVHFQHERRLRMSSQEVKDELKETEGNPQIRLAMRRLAREILKEHLVENVKGATVVVTNPTQYAVALRYRHLVDPSPRVVAKGRGYKAARIREIAREAGVPLVEEAPLARALYRSVKVGRHVPVELYRAVARVLAVILRKQGLRTEVRV